jgi:predicted dinucleotide-binding enzyme
MKIGILGTGAVGKALAKGFAGIGDEVMIGSRDPGGEKAQAVIKEVGAGSSGGTLAEVAKFGEIVVICIQGAGVENALTLAGPENFSGKIVIDVTVPLDFSKGMPPGLFVGTTDSLGEQIQRQLSDAHVVKAFNIVSNPDMVNPDFPGGPPDMLICGNDPAAKKKVTEILNKFGWPTVVDLGGIQGSRVLEPFVVMWVLYGSATGNWKIAMKMLRK